MSVAPEGLNPKLTAVNTEPEENNPDLIVRWWVLGVYCSMQLMNAYLFGTYSSLDLELTQEYYGDHVTKDDVDLLLFWGVAMVMVAFPVSMVTLSRGPSGIALVVRGSAAAIAIGITLRMVPTLMGTPKMESNLLWLNAGAIVIGLSSGLNACPAAISATWFPPEWRVITTGIGAAFMFLGNCLTFLTALPVRDAGDVETLLWLEFLLALVCVSMTLHFPAQPKKPVCALSAMKGDRTVMSGWKLLEKQLADVKLALSRPALWGLAGGTCFSGVAISWCSSIPLLLTNFEPESREWIAFGSVGANAIGCVAAGEYIQAHFQNRYKLVLLLGQVLSTSCLALSLVGHDNFLWTFSFVGGATFFSGATFPCMLELAVEVVYPVEEGTAVGLLMIALNLFATLAIFTFDVLSDANCTYLLIGSSVVSTLCFAFTREEYHRTLADALEEDESAELLPVNASPSHVMEGSPNGESAKLLWERAIREQPGPDGKINDGTFM